MEPTRLEAFSDGIIAFAITLLVLDLQVPAEGGGQLWRELLGQWPSYLAYVTSFATIGIMWLNHHAIFSSVARVDRGTLLLNLLLLFGVASVPFTTSLAATYLRADEGAHLAMAAYAAWMAFIASTFALILGHLGRTWDLVRPGTLKAQNRAARQRALGGVAVYGASALLAVVSPVASLALCLSMAVYYFVAGNRLTGAT